MTDQSTTARNSHGQSDHKQQFYLGFMAGAVIGAGIAYLSSNKSGDTVKQELLKKAKNLAHDLPGILDRLIKESDGSSVETVKQEIREVKRLLTSNPDLVTPPVVEEEPTSNMEKVEQAVAQTASRAKRFFMKAGKMLG